LQFDAGTTLVLGLGPTDAVSLTFDNFQATTYLNTAGPVMSAFGTGFVFLYNNNTSLVNGSGTETPFLSVTDGASVTGEFLGSAECGGTPGSFLVIDIDANSFGEFFFIDQGIMLDAGIINFTGGGSGYCYMYVNSSYTIGTSYLSAPYTLVLQDSAPLVKYTAAVPANWSGTSPTTVQEAFDRIAAHVGPIP
jgi:hypothetical protein